MKNRKFDENQIAEEIVSVLPAGVAREFSFDRRAIRFAVRDANLKLRTIVLSRESLRRLIDDPAGAIKIEYLQRDLLAAAEQRSEFRYPRPVVHVATRPQFALPLVSAR